jgi:hypothetical protein
MDIAGEDVVDDYGFTPEQDAVGDSTDSTPNPPDRPVASTDFGTTIAEERDGESLDGRLARELPDNTLDSPGVIDEGLTGRLVDTDEGAYGDTEKDVVAYDAGPDGGGASAEEAAMHVVPE